MNCEDGKNLFVNESIDCGYSFYASFKLNFVFKVQENSPTPDTNKSFSLEFNRNISNYFKLNYFKSLNHFIIIKIKFSFKFI